MKFINPTFNTKKVRKFVSDLIRDYRYETYDNLSFSDKCHLSSHLMDAVGRFGEQECLVESNDLDQIIYLLKKSLSGNTYDDQNLIFNMKESVINYYSETMELIFDDVKEEMEKENEEWLDYLSHYGDPDEAYDNYRSMI